MLLFDQVLPSGAFLFFSDSSIDFSLINGGFSLKQQACLDSEIPSKRFPVYHLNQTHGTEIAHVCQDCDQSYSQADAVVTNILFRPIAIRTADCLPVFIFDQKRKCIGLVHAGWKGTSARIVSQVVVFMQENYGSQPEDLWVVLGPSIRECCYEVGEEFLENFQDHLIKKEKKIYFDLCAANKKQVFENKIKESHVLDCGICTCCHESFFSYRRQGLSSGRHLSVMMLQG